ncbi:hypothetical protein AAVH_19547 [Aphelenchoides avenae]|nr:hypothetical protein AAVH_19547 [Aphelenchus avenae]
MQRGDRVAPVWEFFDHETGKCRIDGCTYKPKLDGGKTPVPVNLEKHLKKHKSEFETFLERKLEKKDAFSFTLTGQFNASVLQALAEVANSDTAMPI